MTFRAPWSLALVAAAALVVLGDASSAAQVCGDATGDDEVTVTDGVQTLRAAAELSSLCTTAVCDVNGDGQITVTDGVNVLRKAAGLAITESCDLGGSTPIPTPSPSPLAIREELRPVIEALFLGTGALRPSDGASACPDLGFMSGFPRGTAVRVRISTTVSADKRQAIEAAVGQVAMATNGAITASSEVVDDPDPRPGLHEVTSTANTDPVSEGCPFSVGCIIHDLASPGVFRGGRAVQPPSQTINAFAHDVVGHGIIGMCHIDGTLNGGAGLSLMSGGPGVFSGDTAVNLSPLDIEAAQAVYGSGLSAGATRADFIRVGLITP